jgi:predicted RNase H-like HicB family nuclease
MSRIDKKFQFNVVFKPEKEGGFTVLVPLLPGCVSYGETLEEAKKMIADAIDGYIFSMKKRGEIIETDANSFISTLSVNGMKYA